MGSHHPGEPLGLFRTIDDIVGNPVRSPFWKIVDVTVLCVLWTAMIVSLVGTFDVNATPSWAVAARVLVPSTLVATARVWYRHPKLSRRARDKMARRDVLESAWRAESDRSAQHDR